MFNYYNLSGFRMCFNSRILSSIFLHTTGGTHKDPMSHAIYTPGKAYVASGIQPTSSVSLTGLWVPPHVDLPTQKPSHALLFHVGLSAAFSCPQIRSSTPGFGHFSFNFMAWAWTGNCDRMYMMANAALSDLVYWDCIWLFMQPSLSIDREGCLYNLYNGGIVHLLAIAFPYTDQDSDFDSWTRPCDCLLQIPLNWKPSNIFLLINNTPPPPALKVGHFRTTDINI